MAGATAINYIWIAHCVTRWNRIDSNKVLRPGQALTLYVDIRNAY